MTEEKESYKLTDVNAQRIMDRDAAYETLKRVRLELAAMKVQYRLAQRVGGIKDTHPNQVLEGIRHTERVVETLTEYCGELDGVGEGEVYTPSDLTIVKGSPNDS